MFGMGKVQGLQGMGIFHIHYNNKLFIFIH